MLSSEGGFAVRWRHRPNPLDAVAVAARGNGALRLAQRLIRCPDQWLGRLSGVAGRALIVVTGDRVDLPWVEGVQYLGRTPDAPSVLVPTNLIPSCPAALLERALLRRAGGRHPQAVLIGPPLLVPLDHARQLDRRALELWLEGWSGAG